MRIVKPITITDSILVSSNVPEKDAQIYSPLIGYNLKEKVVVLNNHTVYEVSKQETSVVTISQGSPAVVTWQNHGLANGRMVKFSTTGSLPTGVSVNTVYYVTNSTANTFNLSTKDPLFSRASVGTYFDSAGALQTAVVNALRVSYDPTDLAAPANVLIESAATNYIKNNTMAGAVVGNPGTLPNNWSAGTTSNGVSRSIVGVGIENGINYIDIAFTGTAAGGAASFFPNIDSGVTASSGQTWVGSAYLKKLSGNNPSVVGLVTSGRKSDGSVSEDGLIAAPLEFENLCACRVKSSVSLSSNQTTSTLLFLLVSFNVGTTANCVIRIGLPQLERDQVTSVIKTSSGFDARAADIIATTPSYGTLTNTSTAGSGTHSALALVNNIEPSASPTFWLTAGATNRWKMFDKAVQSQTTSTTSLVTKLRFSERVDTFPALNLTGSSVRVQVTNPLYGTIYDETAQLLSDNEPVIDMMSYLNTGFTQRTEVVFEDIPPYANNEFTLTVSGPTGATVGVGAAVFGQARDISSTGLGVEQGARFGIDDYSIKTRDSFGNYVITERAFSDRANVTVFVNNSELASIKNFLTSLRATPVVFIGSRKFDYLTIYGFYKSWEVDVAYPDFSVLSMEVSGLT